MGKYMKVTKVDTSALRRRFMAMSRRAQNFTPVFRWMMQELQKHIGITLELKEPRQDSLGNH